MVKYNHCKNCGSIYSTATWIGEVHTYNGTCPSCIEGEQREDQMQQEKADDRMENTNNTEQDVKMIDNHEPIQSSAIEIERSLLSNLEQRANEVLSGVGSIHVLIREIKDGLVDKAKKRIEETFQSFDVNKIDAQKIIDYTENILDYLSEYKDYMDNVMIKIQTKPKMKVKTALEKVHKETLENIPKNMAKDDLLNKTIVLKTVFGKAVEWHTIYSDTKDVSELTRKMVLHPINEIQEKLSTLPFYASK